ncbi:RagB/SusD family nutrient uptake outer membrane protein [Mucilaginibacter arboris]|uniref:RagB/SusD family nutrient uptake outer membrane protein n=1 Tax=Mucilaginibacter arboris TaxID=2682090 RepID=A0A7K1SVJ0_9SPHI|nr:RagB/SusD family nutrient uptake outer membrane protein [Mucilaginibacter arboris]MVN21341.1 RagB/SusD family nutrient uptake outer membrane protein [Mucilaginibacter arboris]
MKKRFLYSSFSMIILTVVSMSVSSCKKYLTEKPVASFSTDAAFQNVTTATDVVLGVYQKLAGDAGYGIRLSFYFSVDNDEFLGPTNNTSADGDRRDIARYGANASNAQIEAPLNNLYAGIERANICIKYIPLMPQYTSGSTSDQAALKRLYGEALTLRAQFYFDLIKNWGDVPAQFVPSADMPSLVIPKTDRDVIYDHILNDLKTAEDIVPWRTDVATRDERITKGAVKGLRARIALFRGGYSLRTTSGMMERKSDYLTYYQIAKDECSDLMNHREQHTLNTSFQNLFKNYVDAHTLDPTYEIMFEVAMGGGSSASDSKIGYYDGPRLVVGSTSYGSSSILLVPTYFYAFDPNDTRRDVTIAPYYANLDGTKAIQKLVSACLGKFRRDWIANPSYMSASTTGTQYFGVNWPLLRFSDVLLMYAEADNEINGKPSTTAIAAFNEVRTRGFGGSTALIGTTPTTHDDFFNAIVNERSFELGGEAIRKYDLIRWNLLNTKITSTRAGLTAMLNKTAPYANLPQSMYALNNSQTVSYSNSLYAATPSATPTGYSKIAWISSLSATYIANVAQLFTPNHGELLPFPQATLSANPLLTQNPGY